MQYRQNGFPAGRASVGGQLILHVGPDKSASDVTKALTSTLRGGLEIGSGKLWAG